MTHKLDRRLVFFLLALLLAFSVLLLPSVVYAEEPADCADVDAAGQDDYQAENNFTPAPDAVSPPAELEVVKSEPTPSQTTPTSNEAPASGEVTPAGESADASTQTESANQVEDVVNESQTQALDQLHSNNEAEPNSPESGVGNSYSVSLQISNIIGGGDSVPNTDVYVLENRSFQITFTELNETMKLGSARVTIPEGFTDIANVGDLTTGWDYSLVERVLSLWASDSDNYLGKDDSFSVGFDATTPGYAGNFIFETEAWTAANADHSGVYGADDKINNMADKRRDPEVLVGYQIGTPERLNAIRDETNEVDGLVGHYILVNDIDLAAYLADGGAGYNDGAGWEPIGSGSDWVLGDSEYQPFTGSFSGNGYTISNLVIDRDDQDDVGLFGFIAGDARISDLNLANATIIGDYYVGSLVGANDGAVVDCTVQTANLKGNGYVGGLIGYNFGSIANCSATAVVITPLDESTGGNGYGGLVGANEGSITDSNVVATSVTGRGSTGGMVGINYEGLITRSSASGTVSGTERTGGLVGNNSKGIVTGSSADVLVTASGNYAGGLIGYSENGEVNGSHATGDVTGAGTTSGSVGGLIGYNTASESSPAFDGCTASGDVVGFRYVGGLIGQNFNIALVDCHSYGDVTANYGDGKTAGIGNNVGGLVGSTNTSITNCSATGDVSGHSTVGGLAGSASAEISGSYAIGKVTGFDDGSYNPNQPHSVGGLVGNLDGSIAESYAEGDVSGYRYAGGLVGQASGSSIVDSYATGSVTGKGDAVGGLAGLVQSSGKDPFFMNRSYAAGTVTGDGIGVGGLIGKNEGRVEESYASGAVTGLISNVGGLVGSNQGVIFNSYASGDVTGAENVGGLAGYHTSSIENSYAVGRVVGSNSVSAGGLVGALGSTNGGPGGHVANCYYDSQTTGQNDDSGKGTPKTTAEMKTMSTFSGWDISLLGEFDPDNPSTWKIDENSDYPRLGWQEQIDPADPTPDPDPDLDPDPDPGFEIAFQFDFFTMPNAQPNSVGDLLPQMLSSLTNLVNSGSVGSATRADLQQALADYQSAYFQYLVTKDLITVQQRAYVETELALAWAAIQAIQAAFAADSGEPVDLESLLEAYDAAKIMLNSNSSLFSEARLALATNLLEIIAAIINAL